MAASVMKSLENIVSAKETHKNFGWKVTWNVSDGILYVKRENSSAHLRIDEQLKITGIRCMEKVFEITFVCVTLSGINKTLDLLEVSADDNVNDNVVKSTKGRALDQIKPVEKTEDLFELFEVPKKDHDYCRNVRFSQDENENCIKVPKRKLQRSMTVDQKALFCDICDKSFNSKGGLGLHKTVMHGESRLKCDECSRSFKAPRYLKIHQKAMHNSRKMESPSKKETDDELYCHECKQAFATKPSLIRHKNSNKHKENCVFTCGMCDFTSLTKTGLAVHKYHRHRRMSIASFEPTADGPRFIHAERTFICEVCHFRAATNYGLKQHLMWSHQQYRAIDLRSSHRNLVEADQNDGESSKSTEMQHNNAEVEAAQANESVSSDKTVGEPKSDQSEKQDVQGDAMMFKILTPEDSRENLKMKFKRIEEDEEEQMQDDSIEMTNGLINSNNNNIGDNLEEDPLIVKNPFSFFRSPAKKFALITPLSPFDVKKATKNILDADEI